MNMNIVRAKKDTTDRQNVSTEKQALLSENAPLEIELTDADLEAIYGGDGGGGLLGLPLPPLPALPGLGGK